MLPAYSDANRHNLKRVSSKVLKLQHRWLTTALQRAKQPQWRLLAWCLLAVLLVAAGGYSWQRLPARSMQQAPAAALIDAKPLLNTTRDHLIIYAFSNSDPEYLENLKYFVQEAVVNDTLADCLIIVQEGPDLQKATLPELPDHAAYVPHENECYDWGSYGWVLLQTGFVNIKQYRYFFFINSSVRGPYLPAYARGWYHWMSAFTPRLNDDVKLVGSTISCEGSPLHGKLRGHWKRNPHVQSYAVATDQVGLQILLKDKHVFGCHKDRWDTIFYSELGSSLAILTAGYNIDCLMMRYQGIDWRDTSTWQCNERMSPVFEHSCDGLSLDPIEVMFVKVKSYMLYNGFSACQKAAKYQLWQQQEHLEGSSGISVQPRNLSSNEYVDELHKFKAGPVLLARARNARCFDFTYYSSHNPDLKPLWNDVRGLWRHWVYYGQFDYRPHKWLCDIDYHNMSAWTVNA